ncbi:MFS transporter [Zafaria sp. Z1313]|uniref:MFS transporter n=1 Tax=Zafaria sp. Z1313 TaxID=3423202 RepID=UPI003D302C69
MSAYFASGIVVSTLVSRLPTVRDDLGLSHGEVGLLLLCLTLGSFITVSLSGLIVLRLGSGNAIKYGATLVGAALLLAGFGSTVLNSVPVTGTALALLGAGTAVWNVASNVQGAAMEAALGRVVMPVLHGFFSVGTVVGAGIGAACAALLLPVGWHFSASGLGVVALVWWASRTFRPDARPGAAPAPQSVSTHTGALEIVAPPVTSTSSTGASVGGRAAMGRAWREGRTVLLGIMVLGMALAEGAAGDWVALALADGYGTADSVGALGYGVFVTAMMTARLLGGRVIERLGRVAVMRLSAVTAFAGLLLFVFGPTVAVGFAGLALWGLGVALTFPVAMTAAADDPRHAAARVSVVSTLGYGAFLCGPPLLGLLADQIGLLNALLLPAVLVVVSFTIAGAARPAAAASRLER